MSSVPEVNGLELQDLSMQKSRWRTFADTCEVWNRKLHFYLGLYLLLFIWLFSFSGLLLNHQWEFSSSFWAKRKQSTVNQAIQPPPDGTNLEKAKNLMRQLDITGEIELGDTQPQPGSFDFQVSRPGHIFGIHADFVKKEAAVQRIEVNEWGIIRILHTFSGVRRGSPGMQRDWFVTKIWCFSMDAVAMGLIFMVLGSYYMWYVLKKKRLLGWITLAAGFLVCGFFVVALSWLYPMK